MSEYTKLLAKSGIRFTGSPVTLSPQLNDYGMQNVLNPIASERKVVFRVVLYVPNLESNELRIIFPTDNTMEVHMEHPQRKVTRRQEILWSRDCRYIYRLPDGVGKGCLTATWTHDKFLVIQSRCPRPVTVVYEEKEGIDQLIPSKVCGILRPYLDLSILKEMMWLHQTEVDEMCNYLETKGVVPDDRDVMEMLKNFPGKRKNLLKPKECKATEGQKSETESEGPKSEQKLETIVEKIKMGQTASVDTTPTLPA